MQQVNLYLAEFAPTPQRFSLRTLIQLMLAMVVLLLVIGLFLYQQLTSQRELTQAARARLDSVVTTISQTRGNEQARQQVAEQLQHLRQQLEQREALLRDLQQREAKQTSGFAPLLQRLAEGQDNRIWLTHIARHGEELQLAGETTQAAAVPIWLDRLLRQPPLQGLRFAGLQMARLDDKPGVLAFSLNPTLPGGDGNGNEENRDATAQR